MDLSPGKRILVYGTFLIVGTFFLVLSLIRAKAFLAPFATAVIFSLLVLPLARRMEKGPFNRVAASLINSLLLLLASLVLLLLLSLQVRSFTKEWDQITQTMKPKIENLKQYLITNTPLEAHHFERAQNQDEPGSSEMSASGSSSSQSEASQSATRSSGLLSPSSNPFNRAMGALGAVSGVATNFLLCLIYIFFLLNYRTHFKHSLLRLFPRENRPHVKEVIEKAARVAEGYLVGKLLLMVVLFVLYVIGLGLSGVSNFIIVSALAAIFTLIPYVGNIIGMALAMAFGYLTSGDTMVLVGILLTFTLAQFFESYILQPYVMGDRVGVHPFFIIVVVIVGNMMWGVIGMVLAIPILGILNVIFNHIPVFHPIAYLLNMKNDK